MPEQAPAQQYNPTDGQSFAQNAVAGYGRALPVLASGIKQAGLEAANRTGGAIFGGLSALGMDGAAQGFAKNVGAPVSSMVQEGQADIDEERRLSAPLRGTAGGFMGNLAGDVAMMAPAGGGVLGLAKTGGQRLLGNAAVGAGFSGAQPVETGGNRAVNAGVGFGAGAGGALLGNALSASAAKAVKAVNPLRKELMAVADRAGIPLHLSQMSQSTLAKTMASTAKYLPFSGANKAANAQQGAFNKAIAKTFGADADQLTDDVMIEARKKLGAQFEDIYARNDVPLSPDSVRKLLSIETGASRRLTKDQGEIVKNQLDDILAEMKDGTISGQKYQSLRTQIMKAEGPDAVGNAVKDLRKAFDDVAADAVGPEDAATLKRLRGQWANFRTTDGLLKQMAGSGGDVKPSAIWAAIRKGSTKEMRELGRLGQVLIKDPIPDSGTAGRFIAGSLMAGGGLTGGLSALPAMGGLVLAGATVGRALNSSALAKMMGRSTPGSARNALSRISPAAGVAAGPVVGDQLDPLTIEIVGGRRESEVRNNRR